MGKEEFYHLISKSINIDDHRQEYTNIYNFIRDSVLNGLKENQIFKQLFCDLILCGSYADGLKISLPDEFDVVMRLTFPHLEEVEIERDPHNCGNVLINLSEMLNDYRLWQNKKYELMYEFLRKMVNSSGYFLQNKFQSWMESCMVKYLKKIDYVLTYIDKSGSKYKCTLNYRKQGPAHTIDVKFKNKEFSIDFVPGFRFTADTSKATKPFNGYWEAIPRPAKHDNPYFWDNPSFRCSYTGSERVLFKNKNQFKNTLRLMKKFRDMNRLTNLKSYYIKTLFLHTLYENQHGHFNRPNETLMEEMFEKLEDALKNRDLPYFWDEELNLLENLTPYQVNNMYYEVKNTREALLNAKESKEILDIFLSEEEQDKMSPKIKEDIEKSWLEYLTSYLPLSSISSSNLIAGVGIFAGAALLFSYFSRPNNQQN